MLAVLDLLLDSSDEWARESCEKRDVAVVELHEAMLRFEVNEGMLRPVARDECEPLAGLESAELFLRACCLSTHGKSGGEYGS